MTMLPGLVGILDSSPIRHDPKFANVYTLCHCDGTNGSSVFTNVVYPTRGSTFGAGGSPAVVVTTANKLFGTGSADFAGGFIGSTSPTYVVGTGDFAYEIAFRTGTPSQTGVLIDTKNTSTNKGIQLAVVGSTIHAWVWNINANIVTAGTVLTNTWQRLLWDKTGGISRILLDGTQIGVDYTDSNDYGTVNYVVGAAFNGGAAFTGQADELRTTLGTNRHSTNYTVDAAAFPDS